MLKAGAGVFVGDEVGNRRHQVLRRLAAEPGPIGPVATPAAPTSATANTPPSQVQDGGLNVILWGGYSATVIDPTNPDEFWTFQSFADAQSSGDTQTWGVQATRVTVDFPAVSLSVSGPLPVSTPQSLGIVGDDIMQAPAVPRATAPNWVTQLTNSGEFSVGARANQATGGATASSLTTQDSAIETVTGLNDVVVMIGENDAVALAQGPQTTTAQDNFVTTIVSEIEGAITNLIAGLPNTDHLIVATIPDVFVTPEIQALGLSSTNLLADESAVQEANAQITQFALAKGIPVVDLYGLYSNLLTKPLTIDNTTFSTSTMFAANGLDPAPIVQGLIADAVVDATDLGYASGLAPLSNQTLLTDAGDTDTVTGPTFLNLSPYVLTPVGAPTTTITATLLSPTGSAHDEHARRAGQPVAGRRGRSGHRFFISGEYFTPGTTPSWQPAILIEAGQTSGSITLNGLGELSTLVVANVEPPTASPTTPAVEGGVELTQQEVTAKLSQDALPAIVTLNVSTNQISESPIGTVTVTASLPAGQVAASNIIVNLTLGGTATEGTDYIASGTEIVIPKGQSSGSITLTATGNPIALNETIIVTMTGLNGAYNQSPQQVLVTLTPGGTASGTISGTVKDSSGNPLSGVIVYLYPPGTVDVQSLERRQHLHDHERHRRVLHLGTYVRRHLHRERADSDGLFWRHLCGDVSGRRRPGGHGLVLDAADGELHRHARATRLHRVVGSLQRHGT